MSNQPPGPEVPAMESLLIAFLVVGLAELGDKTQLVTLYLAARFRRPLAVLGGVFAASLLNLGLAVLVGAWLGRFLGNWLELVVALMFIAMGLWLLWHGNGDDEEGLPEVSGRGAFATTFLLFFLMEMGDKTQLATLGLAAGLTQPVLVLTGAVLAMMAANAPAIWLGHRYASRLPVRLLQRISALVFILVGVVLLLSDGLFGS